MAAMGASNAPHPSSQRRRSHLDFDPQISVACEIGVWGRWTSQIGPRWAALHISRVRAAAADTCVVGASAGRSQSVDDPPGSEDRSLGQPKG